MLRKTLILALVGGFGVMFAHPALSEDNPACPVGMSGKDCTDIGNFKPPKKNSDQPMKKKRLKIMKKKAAQAR